MTVRNEQQMNSLKKRTYGTITAMGLAATVFFAGNTYISQSDEIESLNECKDTVSVKDRMHCAWQNDGVKQQLIVDDKIEAQKITQNGDSTFSLPINDVNVYETDAALAIEAHTANSDRGSDTATISFLGLCGTLFLDAIAGAALVRTQRWDSNKKEFYYTK